jgi:hypothetical protein
MPGRRRAPRFSLFREIRAFFESDLQATRMITRNLDAGLQRIICAPTLALLALLDGARRLFDPA